MSIEIVSMGPSQTLLWKSVYRHILWWSMSSKHIFDTKSIIPNKCSTTINRTFGVGCQSLEQNEFIFIPTYSQYSDSVSSKSFLTGKLSGMVIYYQLTKLQLILLKLHAVFTWTWFSNFFSFIFLVTFIMFYNPASIEVPDWPLMVNVCEILYKILLSI